jgi:hypothetical protein
MNLQNALTTLAGAFLSFYLGCVAVGRPDIPWKIIAQMRGKALTGASSDWGCPSLFNKNSCSTYDSVHYRGEKRQGDTFPTRNRMKKKKRISL